MGRGYAIDRMCRILGVSRAGYYKWLNRKPTDRELRNSSADENIVFLFHMFDETYGYRRIRNEMETQLHVRVSAKYVLHRMKRLGIRSRIRRRHANYCYCEKTEVYENILSRRFSTTVRNMIWETDVTEFHTPDGKKVYLSAIMDRFDHSIVSFNMSFHNDQDLVSTDLRKALAENPGCTPILHSDRGSTYTTKAYNDILRSRDMLHSMSRVNRCIDNGPMEGFWGTLKCEAYYGKHIRTAEELMDAVRHYMYFYNHERRQESLCHKAPYEYRSSGIVLLPSSFPENKIG